MPTNTAASPVQLGIMVLSRNDEAGFNNQNIQRHFRQITRVEMSEINKGTIAWFRIQVPGRGIFGFVKRSVTALRNDQVHFGVGRTSSEKDIFLAVDESALSAAIADDPKATMMLEDNDPLWKLSLTR